MENKACCFTGHRVLPKSRIGEIREMLTIQLKKLIEQGFSDFYAGGALGFDTLAALCVLELKKEYPHIRLHLIIPCRNQSAKWDEKSRLLYEQINSMADETVCLSPVYFDGCMLIRNKYMVDRASVCIAYLERAKGGSAATVKYAKEKQLDIINISSLI